MLALIPPQSWGWGREEDVCVGTNLVVDPPGWSCKDKMFVFSNFIADCPCEFHTQWWEEVCVCWPLTLLLIPLGAGVPLRGGPPMKRSGFWTRPMRKCGATSDRLLRPIDRSASTSAASSNLAWPWSTSGEPSSSSQLRCCFLFFLFVSLFPLHFIFCIRLFLSFHPFINNLSHLFLYNQSLCVSVSGWRTVPGSWSRRMVWMQA